MRFGDRFLRKRNLLLRQGSDAYRRAVVLSLQLFFSTIGGCSPFRHVIVDQAVSPDGRWSATAYVPGGGVLAGNTCWVELQKYGNNLGDSERVRIFAMRESCELSVSWVHADTLLIVRCPGFVEEYDTSVSDIAILVRIAGLE